MKDSFVNKVEYGIDHTSTSLLFRAKLEDQEAWAKIVSLYSPVIYRWCRSFGLSGDESQGVGQDVFIALLRKLPEFEKRKEQASFRSWLKKITKNKCLDFLRLKHEEAEAMGGTNAQEFMQQIATYEKEKEEDPTLRQIEKVILYRQAMGILEAEFSDRDWTIFVRVVVEGRDPLHVAEELETSVNNVYVVKSRVLRCLREEFADLIGD